MLSPRAGSPRRSDRRKWSLLAGAAVLSLAPLTGCQVEYAGMTLPSGKYMHDDVQYFSEGPAFPWANTQAATQRARMSAMGMTPPPPPSTSPNSEANPATLLPTKAPAPPGADAAAPVLDINPPAAPAPGAAAPAAPRPKPVPPPAGAEPGPQ